MMMSSRDIEKDSPSLFSSSQRNSRSDNEESRGRILSGRFSARKRRSLHHDGDKPDEAGSTILNETHTNHLPSINSGFLAGLFDDVTKINVLQELKLDPAGSNTTSTSNSCNREGTSMDTRTTTTNCDSLVDNRTSDDVPPVRTVSPSSQAKDRGSVVGSVDHVSVDPLHLLDSSSYNKSYGRPSKKSRLSLINVPSLTRLRGGNMDRVSYWNLTDRSSTFRAQSRNLLSYSLPHNTSGASHGAGYTVHLNKPLTRESSLNRLFSQVSFSEQSNFQSNPATLALDALSASTRHINTHTRLTNASTCSRFPALPCTISESSCDDSRRPSPDGVASHANSNSSLEESSSFGWFVDTDDGDDDDDDVTGFGSEGTFPSTTHGPSSANSTKKGLAFQAPTAPKGRSIQDDAEIEWAQAADTVDSVLGDMF